MKYEFIRIKIFFHNMEIKGCIKINKETQF
jgi:hypothetical protein